MKFSKELNDAIKVALKAGKIMITEASKIRNHKNVNQYIQYKKVKGLTEHEVVTVVDKKIDKYIISSLTKKYPKYYLLTEESFLNNKYSQRKTKKQVWIVDPIDGTKKFTSYLKKQSKTRNEFSVSIALIKNNQLQLGVIYAPLLDELFVAEKAKGSFLKINNKWQKLALKEKRSKQIVIAANSLDRSELKKKFNKSVAIINMYSAAYRIAAIAKGSADGMITIKDRPKEWDFAAGDIILTEAGGKITDRSNKKFKYNQKNVRPSNSIIAAHPQYHKLFLDKIK